MFLALMLPGGHLLAPPGAEDPDGQVDLAAGEVGSVSVVMTGEVEAVDGSFPGRCMLLQAAERADVDAYLDELGDGSQTARDWEVNQLVPNHAPQFLRDWFGGKFAKAHG